MNETAIAQNIRDCCEHAIVSDKRTVCGRRITEQSWFVYPVENAQRIKDVVSCIPCRISIGTLPANWAEEN